MIGHAFSRSLLGVALVAALSASTAAAQDVDSRWRAFLGCWVPAGADASGLLCFRPAAGGVEMYNVVGGEVTAVERLVADGVARSVSAEGCTGTERVEFSGDGARAFTHSEFQCSGEARAGSGIMAFVSPQQWIDVRSMSVRGEPVAWAQAYEVASESILEAQGVTEDPAAREPNLTRAARIRAARELEVPDVEEAAARLEPRAVEVWVAARESGFELNAKEIVRLADSGVAESIIDVMVAVSYPDRFVVSPEGTATPAEGTAAAEAYPPGYRRGYGSYLFSPFRDPLGFRYSPLYSRFGAYGYDGFGGLYGGYGGYWGYMPATIVVQPATPVQEPRGRMVPGRGYTRQGDGYSGGGGSGTRPASSSGSDGYGPTGGDGGSSGGGSSGGGGDSGRTAQPRSN